jgi:hypothetical protein
MLNRKEMTQAIARYAKAHGFSAHVVRSCTSLKRAAISAWRVKK